MQQAAPAGVSVHHNHGVPRCRLTARGRSVALAAAILACAGVISACGSTSHDTSTGEAQNPRPQLYSTWGQPTGGQRPRALLLMIHGGGWQGESSAAVKAQAAIAVAYQRLGYETLTFDYRAGRQSIRDADAFYRYARQRVGPNMPICALGPSAGGHISLMLAVHNPDLACVIDFAGPTNLVSLAHQRGGGVAYRLAVQAFGASHLPSYSPALQAKSIRAKVMLVFARTDPIVPAAQGGDMVSALTSARLIVLPPGPVGFVHTAGGPGTTNGVATAAYNRSLAAETAFLADTTSAWRRGHQG